MFGTDITMDLLIQYGLQAFSGLLLLGIGALEIGRRYTHKALGKIEMEPPVRLLLVRVANLNPRVAQDPVPVIGVGQLGDSSINISVKPWVAVSDYVPAQAELYQAIVEAFGTDRIQIPFPQREIRMLNAN